MFSEGIYVASVTPFNDRDEFDPLMLKKLMERNLSEGAAGFFIGGSSAECFLLSHGERLELFRAASEFSGRKKLIAHVGAMSEKEAIEFALEARKLNYDRIAATPPLYYHYSPEEICNYYYNIAKASDMPVIIYNFPGNTHIDLDLSNKAYRDLLMSGAIKGIKHTNQVVYQMERFINLNPDLEIYNGFDETMVAGLSLGARASIGSTFNCLLPLYLDVYNTFMSGDIVRAEHLQHRANNTMEAMCRFGLIPSIKYILRAQGFDCGLARRPFRNLTEEEGRILMDVLEKNL